jgi:hypothetical protein
LHAAGNAGQALFRRVVSSSLSDISFFDINSPKRFRSLLLRLAGAKDNETVFSRNFGLRAANAWRAANPDS